MKIFLRPFLPMAFGVALFFTSCKEESVEKQSLKTGSESISANSSVAVSPLAVTYSLNNWMGSVSSTAKLSQLTIPGTHDSGARYEPISGTAKCQNLTIAEQLNAGIRFLDVRCRHIDNSFTIHHGAVYQNINFDDVLNASFAFLSSNPSETIIMSIKEEHTAENTTRSFEATFNSYIQKNPTKWYVGETIPTLSQVRGKIVLLRRFSAASTPKGINATAWADNTTFEINTAQAKLKVQDAYKVSDNNAKWAAMQTLFTEAKAGAADRLYINFASGYKPGLFGIPNITTVSNAMNPKVSTFFTAQSTGRFGIIPMDFAEAGRNNLLIKTNF